MVEFPTVCRRTIPVKAIYMPGIFDKFVKSPTTTFTVIRAKAGHVVKH
jgi:hypothetical protein